MLSGTRLGHRQSSTLSLSFWQVCIFSHNLCFACVSLDFFAKSPFFQKKQSTERTKRGYKVVEVSCLKAALSITISYISILIETLGKIKFIAVHYRFDKSDWMKHCDEHGQESNQSCNQVVDILNDIPKALNYFADFVENQMMMHDIGAVYMAAPPSEAEVKSGMEIILKERLGDDFKLLSAADLVPYIHQQWVLFHAWKSEF